jgi:hypothetical protein
MSKGQSRIQATRDAQGRLLTFSLASILTTTSVNVGLRPAAPVRSPEETIRLKVDVDEEEGGGGKDDGEEAEGDGPRWLRILR